MNTPVHGQLTADGQLIDDPIVVLSHDGQIADINLHGGPWIVRAVIDLARQSGFTVESANEVPVSLEAVDGDSIIEREMLSSLPMARTELALRSLLAQPKAWATLDLGTIDRAAMLADRSLWWLLHPPRVAIVGAANVGKSTLANQLFAQERSITADLPGTTRDWVGEIANIDGLAVMLVDTPGQRETSDAIERQAIANSAVEIQRADLVIIVLDATMSLEMQRSLLDSYRDALVVVNKSDRPPAWDTPLPQRIATVATTGEGIDGLRRAIQRHFGCVDFDPSKARWWTERQRRLLQIA